MILKIGSRTSRLAMTQTRYIADRLESAWPDLSCEIVPFSTKGDETQAAGIPLPKIGGKGLFTAELEAALRDKRIDLAVHSLKDLPVDSPPGLTVGAIPERVDPHDVLVTRSGGPLADLPPGAVVGTSSLRRKSQLLAVRPDLEIRSIRGNVDTRIRKVREGKYDAAVLAAAGMLRLGLAEDISEWLDYDLLLPAPGQGALGVQCRADDTETLKVLAPLHHAETARCVEAERFFLQGLGGGCSLPVGAYGTIDEEDRINLVGRVFSEDGQKKIAVRLIGSDAAQIGHELADIAIRSGASALLPNDSALNGKRIVVTRTPAQAAAFSHKLAEHQALPIEFPTLKLIPLPVLDFDQFDFNLFDWVIFTSANAVNFFFDLIATDRFQLVEPGWRHFKVAASGKVTASILQGYGIQPDFTPDQFVGEALVNGLGDLRGKQVLFPRSKIGRPSIVRMLTDAGADVTEIPLYDTVVNAPDPEQWAAFEAGFDAVTFTSPSSVRNFMQLAAKSRYDMHELTQKVFASIGPITSDALRELGLPVHVEADPYTIDGLIERLESYFRSMIGES